ncbi:MAG: putative quinol monooxygenase [Bauldia sp.]
MIVVTGVVQIAPEGMDRARRQLRPLIEATRKEQGCLSYAFGEDVLEPGVIRVSERWLNWQALEAHQQSAHVAIWRAALKEIGVVHRDVVAYEAGQGRSL